MDIFDLRGGIVADYADFGKRGQARMSTA